MLSMLPLHPAVVPQFHAALLKVCSVPAVPTFIENFPTKRFDPQPLKTYKFSAKIRSSSLRFMFTPNHWQQTVVCYQTTRVRYSNK